MNNIFFNIQNLYVLVMFICSYPFEQSEQRRSSGYHRRTEIKPNVETGIWKR